MSAMYCVTHQKNPHLGFFPFNEVHSQPQGIVWALIAIRSIIYDDQKFLFRHNASKVRKICLIIIDYDFKQT